MNYILKGTKYDGAITYERRFMERNEALIAQQELLDEGWRVILYELT